ncbi:MAG TPA: sialidase family protein [Longimicrobium sp.]|nr:sialidase family protein [Longimicrobium sp.]
MMDRWKMRAAAALPVALAACGSAGADETARPGVVIEVTSPAGPRSGEPHLAAGAAGRVYMSWLEQGADSTHALRFAVLENGRWSAPRTIARGGDWFINWADFPMLTPLPDGRLAAHWLQRSGDGKYAYDVRVAQSADGGATWSQGVVPHRDGTASEHGFVSMWPAGDSLAVVWLDGRKYAATADEHDPSNEMALVSTTVARDGTLGAERTLDPRVCDCCQTGAAMTARGPIVVYRDRSPDEIRDIYITRHVDGAWTEPKPVHADGWKMPACPVNGPQVAADGQRVAVAWYTAARDTAVQLAFSTDAGATFGAPVRIDAGRPAGRVDVELLADGGALVSWIERGDGERAEVRARRVSADGKAGDPVVVAESSAVRASGFPRMTRAGDAVYFAWTVPGDTSTVRVARMALAAERR